MRDDLYGQDFLLDDNGLVAIAASGEAGVSDGIRTVLQDIMLRLKTPLGSLFYDQAFGSEIIYFVKDENTLANRLALVAEIAKRVQMDQRVVAMSAAASVVSWDENGVMARVTFKIIDETHGQNLVITVDSDMDVVVSDVDPN
ncbi:hypothetical protein [uncultured Desulfobacter sp.]|uniref:hypothetical protein n=1 Tax=uncultured Desulfobacter sp. TaxID=240139 RepID=UPI002AAC0EAE|nr:hypothetical protein [uncultured Desulfobacter sp.]